ncbi:MAG: hypothetical protein J7J36_01130 [Thermoplasmata archaeon]|nr:hypothetical protein [Thermoplasmata archaeon]
MPEAITKEEFEKLKEEVEHLKENIAILSNPEILEKIMEARKRMDEGKGISLEELTKDILGKNEL